MMGTPNGSASSSEFETYDIPKPATPVQLNYDASRGVRTPTSGSALGARFDSLKSVAASMSIEEESYDVPRPLLQQQQQQQQQHTLTPSSSASSLLTSDSLSLSFSSSNRSSLANMPDYDIPRRNPLPVRPHPRPHACTYDFSLPPLLEQEQRHVPAAVNATKELPLELNSALETLAKLQSETTTAITRLLSFVVPHWRP